MERYITERIDERITVPQEQFSTLGEEQKEQEKILTYTGSFLTLPDRAKIENENKDLPKNLGNFLVEQEYIKNISIHHEDWSFRYNNQNKTIYIPTDEMPQAIWRDFIFRKQTKLRNGRYEPLNPMHSIYNRGEQNNELNTYQFLQKATNAYLDYLKDKEKTQEEISSEEYYKNAIKETMNTPFAKLFSFCYSKRLNHYEKVKLTRGFSKWGNIQNYNYEKNEGIPNQNSEHATRALEDTNELITMYLWNPKYFETYMSYLHTNPKIQLYKKGLLKLEEGEAQYLKNSVISFIEEMKENIEKS